MRYVTIALALMLASPAMADPGDPTFSAPSVDVPQTSEAPDVQPAQPQCAPNLEMFAVHVGRSWGERMVARMIDARGDLVVLFRNPRSGSWSMSVTYAANGLTCMLSGGDSSEVRAEASS